MNEYTSEIMTMEEMIDTLKGLMFNSFDRTTVKERQALDMAIKALEQEPCEDRINVWKKDFKGYVNSLSMPKDDYNGIMEYIDELPITPQPSYNSIKTELNEDLIPRQSVITMLNKIENAVEDGDGFQFNEWIYYAKDIPAENTYGDLQKEIDFWHIKCTEYEQTIAKMAVELNDVKEIEHLPSAEKTAEEVAPIIRGKCSITHGMYENRIWCNNCGFIKVITGNEDEYNFCPKCGAIVEKQKEMDGKEVEE